MPHYNPPSTSACVYASRNSRLKGYALYVNGARYGYQVDQGDNPGVRIAGSADRATYTIHPLNATQPDVTVISRHWDNINSTAQPTYATAAAGVPVPNRTLVKEDRVDPGGAYHMRSDSTSVFTEASHRLHELYKTEEHGFANVHDDEADGGGLSDSLDNFMEEMRSLPANLDFFAYSGHGWTGGLASAGLRRNTPEYTEFVEILRRIMKPTGIVVFYACSTGAASGFAQSVSSDVPSVTFFAHAIPGHGQTNPYKVKIRNGNRETFETLLGSDFSKWARYIKGATDVWRRFPFLDIETLRKEVLYGAPLLNPDGPDI